MNKDIEVTLLSPDDFKQSSILNNIKWYRDYWINTSAKHTKNGYVSIAMTYNEKVEFKNTKKRCGIIPVIKINDIDETLKDFNIIKDDNLEVVELGEFPDFGHRCFNCLDPKTTFITGKKYNVVLNSYYFEIGKIEEYSSNGNKFVKIKDHNYPITQAKFYVDRDNNMLISKEVLFLAPININNPNYNGDFKTSELYQYLNNEFIKSLCPSFYKEEMKDEILLKQLEAENQRLKEEIDKKKEILEKLKEMSRQNENLRVQSANLDSEIEKEISKIKVLKRK